MVICHHLFYNLKILNYIKNIKMGIEIELKKPRHIDRHIKKKRELERIREIERLREIEKLRELERINELEREIERKRLKTSYSGIYLWRLPSNLRFADMR
jgi:hypothetical protein